MSTHHYFDENPDVKSDPKSVVFNFANRDFIFVTDRGVFSYEKLDRATRILLDVFNERYEGQPRCIVDVGSGYGAIACVSSHLFPKAQIIAVEPNERARVLTQINFVNNCEGDLIEVFSPDECDDSISADLIISNPPVRVGKEALHSILRDWAKRLDKKGEMWLVIAKNLGADSLAGFIEYELGMRVKRVASKNGFRVLRCISGS